MRHETRSCPTMWSLHSKVIHQGTVFWYDEARLKILMCQSAADADQMDNYCKFGNFCLSFTS